MNGKRWVDEFQSMDDEDSEDSEESSDELPKQYKRK